jgi:uncharacterized protein YraI
LLTSINNQLEDMMRNRLTVSLLAASLLASSAAFAQSTTATGAVNGARAGGSVAGPVGRSSAAPSVRLSAPVWKSRTP